LTGETRVGRPSVAVSLNPTGAYFVGLDISTTSLTAVLIDFAMTVVAKFAVPMGLDFHDVPAVADRLADLTKQAIQTLGRRRNRVRGVGVSVPGLIGRDGRVAIAPLLEWQDLDLRALLDARLKTDLNVRICNDAVALASAVCSSTSDAETQDLLLILLSEGIGSAIVREGRVVEGFNGYAGEIGQMIMGTNCSDGPQQTFQSLAGSRFFLPFLSPQLPMPQALQELAKAQRPPQGFDDALRVWEHRLATGFINVIRVLDPERVVLGGPLAAIYPHVAAQVDSIIRTELRGLQGPPIIVSGYGAEGAAIGAAAMIRETIFTLPSIDGRAEP
jgi:predicted NBD/HSP70 family sugar kinase